MRLLSLVSTLFILLFACSAVAEEGLERYLPSDAIAERGKWDTDIILEAGSHTPLEVEELIVNEARVRYTHSLNASMLMKLPFELEERFEGSAHDVLDMMCKRTALSCFLDDDGTMLVTSDLEGREIADIPVRKHFGEPLSTDATWRMELSHYWKMRVSFGIEHLGEPLSNVDWLWRDCPILLPPSARNDVIIRRQYLHVPLKEALDDILGSCSYRCFPWCGCIYVVNSDEAPGAEPRLWPQEIWRGDGDGAEYLEKALAQRINTGVSKPGPALYTSISKVAPQVEHKLSFDETAKLTHYKGVPAGKMSLGHFLALLERFDEVKTIAGEGWFTLYRGDEPAGKAAAEEKLAQRTVRVGVEIPEYYFETPSFSELPQDRMEKLRKMDASDRLDRTISIAFDNLRLDKALRKLEAIAYFHFSTADDTKELTTSTNVIGYFDQKRVQTVISELCAKCGLKWKLRGKKPPEGEPDTRFMIDLRISGRRPAIGR